MSSSYFAKHVTPEHAVSTSQWIPDSAVTQCTQCTHKFTLLNRKVTRAHCTNYPLCLPECIAVTTPDMLLSHPVCFLTVSPRVNAPTLLCPALSYSAVQHHCRQCGHVFCSKCSSKRLPLKSMLVRSKSQTNIRIQPV